MSRTSQSRTDVCVIGAGVAGGLVAHSLASRGFDVVILEAGPRFDREKHLDRMERAIRPDVPENDIWKMGGERDRYTTSGEEPYQLNTHRVKGVGGATLRWGGWTPRYHEKDFRMHSRYGLADDWPIAYADLQPYYAAAERALGVAGGNNPFEPPREDPRPLPPFPESPTDELFRDACADLDIALHPAPQARNSQHYDGRSKCVGYSTCNPVCPSGAKYSGDVHVRKAEDAGARVIDRAPVRRLDHDGSRITAAVYDTPDRSGRRQRADSFVLAGGGVEIPRLLLNSRGESFSDGLANSSGLVGHRFMEHPVFVVSGIVDRPPEQEPIWWWSLESHQLYDHDDVSPGSIKLEFKQGAPVSPVDGFVQSGGAAAPLLTGSDTPDPDAYAERTSTEWRVAVTGMAEMLPDESNRIGIDHSTTDGRGVPVPDVAFSPGDHAVETLEYGLSVGEQVLDRMGATNIKKSDPLDPPYAAHHMGTTRMSSDSTEGVVDPNCQTHDHRNLYIASSSVFVTAGAMNPTLTIAALALRLADHVAEQH